MSEITYLTDAEAAERAQRIATRGRLARRPAAARTSADVIPAPPAAAEPTQAPAARQANAPGRSRAASAPAPSTSTPPAGGGSPRGGGAPAYVDDGAGFLLGLALWALTLAYLRGGSHAVKDLIRAKFVNKAHDGSWLP
jgi:hypothetical protein